MKLLRETRYGIEALLHLSGSENGELVDAATISEGTGIPGPYLHKILGQLVAAGLLRSRRGRGYQLARSGSDITVREVVEAIEGDDPFDSRCIFWREECSESEPCELHDRWRLVKPAVSAKVGGATLRDLANGRPANRA